MKFDFDVIQDCFVEGKITLDQLIEILVENYGAKKTRKILRRNIERYEKEQKDRSISS